MKFRVFSYAVPGESGLDDLNSFLASNRILNVSHRVVEAGDSAALVFVVEYLDGGGGKKAAREERIDYRRELTAGQFGIFSQLRDLRKTMAEEENVPVYNVFTNAQLVEIVKKKVSTLAGLRGIEGVGASRVEKYGERLLQTCRDLFGGPAEAAASDEGERRQESET